MSSPWRSTTGLFGMGAGDAAGIGRPRRDRARRLRRRAPIPLVVAACVLGLGLIAGYSPPDRPVRAPRTAPPLLRVQADDPTKAKAPGRNRLADSASPYLRLHADNPVDWYPWGAEAFARAKAEDRPIFLSIGYSSCHWCHVMERESFRDPAIARVLNRNFVCVKVDREELPDVDQFYMTALQAFGRGGWPMSMFLLPDGRPFFGGTYYPPDDRDGLTGFRTVLKGVLDAWRDSRGKLEESAEDLTRLVRRAMNPDATGVEGGDGDGTNDDRRTAPAPVRLGRRMSDAAHAALSADFDPEHGGFGYDPATPRRPKFPEPSNLLFLLDRHRRGRLDAPPALRFDALFDPGGRDGIGAIPARPRTRPPLEMATFTLDRMARGGIRDQLAGGYHRYSVHRFWIVPHFEKMLYDNALIASALVGAAELTGDPRWAREAESVFRFAIREMTTPEGGFIASLDAETEGEEGRYYVWTLDEARAALAEGPEREAFLQTMGFRRPPNFEGNRYVPHQPRPTTEQAEALGISVERLEALLDSARAKLLAVRSRRPAPFRDDKIVTGWNGLMIGALADGGRALGSEEWLAAASRAADLILKRAENSGDRFRLPRIAREGPGRIPGYLEDYAFFADGLLRLHRAAGDPARLEQARGIVARMIEDFHDPRNGGFHFASRDHHDLPARGKDRVDGATPSGNAVAAAVLVELARLAPEGSDERARYLEVAESTFRPFAAALRRRPEESPHMLMAMEALLDLRPDLDADAPPPPPLSGSLRPIDAENPPALPLVEGSAAEFVATLELRPGWRIYADPPGAPHLKPTTLTLEPPDAGTLEILEAPAAKTKSDDPGAEVPVSVLEGRLEYRIAVAPSRPIDAIRVRIDHQPCDDRACLPPAVLILEWPPRAADARSNRGAEPPAP